MAVILSVYIIEPDQTIKTGHQFFGHSEEEVYNYFEEHVGHCEYFAAAAREDRIIEELERVPAGDLPRAEDFEEEEEEV